MPMIRPVAASPGGMQVLLMIPKPADGPTAQPGGYAARYQQRGAPEDRATYKGRYVVVLNGCSVIALAFGG